MKKIKTTLTLLMTILMLLSLTGCGGLLNGEKQLTADKLIPTRSEDSNSGVSTSIAELQLYGVYKLTDASGASKLWITFSPFDSRWGYLMKLTDMGNNIYKYTGSSNKSGFSQTDAAAGYAAFTNYSDLTLADAYIVAKENNSSYAIDKISSLIKKDDVVCYDVRNDPHRLNLSSYFSDYAYSSSSYYHDSTTYHCDSYFRYLWVELDDKIWVCLGDVW